MHLAVLGTFLLIFAFLIPSLIFWSLEPGWSFLDCIYFVFISLTTIGTYE
jgi:Ion channel